MGAILGLTFLIICVIIKKILDVWQSDNCI